MSYALDRPGFSVRVEGGFVGHGTWLNHAVVAYRPHAVVEAGGDVTADGRLQVSLAIASLSQSARVLGARSVYVLVEGDSQVAGFFRVSDATPDRETARKSRKKRMSISPSKRPARPRIA
jgi:hypothetical protein